jgi:hypothetical protein
VRRRIAIVLVSVLCLAVGTFAGVALATQTDEDLMTVGMTFSRHHESISGITSPPGVTQRSGELLCPQGGHAIGGGGYVHDSNGATIPITASWPFTYDGREGWSFLFNHSGFSSPFTKDVYVTCVR